jgi:enamine deaminase RidA (YjgF/YER057c/UK114 family)
MTIDQIQPGAWNSKAVIHGDTIYMSGIVADDTTVGMKQQTEEVLAKIDAVLAEAGSDKTKIVSSVVYMSDMDLKSEMNEAWMEWMDPAFPPARAGVGVVLTPGHLVEIMCTAVK